MASQNFSRREIAVLAALCEGRSNRQIAAQIHVAPSTAGNIVWRMTQKVHAPNRIVLAVWAERNRILD